MYVGQSAPCISASGLFYSKIDYRDRQLCHYVNLEYAVYKIVRPEGVSCITYRNQRQYGYAMPNYILPFEHTLS